ncbi:MAG: cytidine deaminase [Oscillospiraceae bacterium]
MTKTTDTMLLENAVTASKNAYAPYSHFLVGAAVLGGNGKVYTGCNVENASYGLTNCAERTAIFSMVADGCSCLSALAIYSPNKAPVYPCGACRQVMLEFCQNENTPIYLYGKDSEIIKTTIGEVLPFAFDKTALK